MYFIISILSIFTSLIFIFMSHPLAMGFMLLTQTLLISIVTGLLSKTFWFSYILFIVFLGGMLVLFIYVTSLASNEMFMMSMKTTQLLMITLFMTTAFMLIVDNFNFSSFLPLLDMSPLPDSNSFISENTINLNKLYNYPTNFLTIMLINYLFLTLIAVVKVTNIFYGPLRPRN
uniref:NADH-ubiquinone oxidoreductase chain 6 n=1 Tax=Simulium jisigouense TaxID=2893561 RepID=A0A9Y2TCH4_9DIPT|nr:NADH dehydrogenase subunit 6 [Simulium jisigouense]WIV81719.1 NADH dehydrogenase subunit 6 [Simulium jisigouense]